MRSYRGAVSKLGQFIVMVFRVRKTKVHVIEDETGGWRKRNREFKLIEPHFSEWNLMENPIDNGNRENQSNGNGKCLEKLTDVSLSTKKIIWFFFFREILLEQYTSILIQIFTADEYHYYLYFALVSHSMELELRSNSYWYISDIERIFTLKTHENSHASIETKKKTIPLIKVQCAQFLLNTRMESYIMFTIYQFNA